MTQPGDLTVIARVQSVTHPRTLSFLQDKDLVTYDFDTWWSTVEHLADRLGSTGLNPGDRVVITAAEPYWVATGFMACLAAGVVPSVSAPRTFGKSPVASTLRSVEASGAQLVLNDVPDASLSEAGLAVAVLPELMAAQRSPKRTTPRPDDIAYCQFSSGSTGTPKIIEVTHRQLSANSCASGAHIFLDVDTDAWCSWLPMHHDMGLVASLLVPLWLGIPVTFMKPSSFVRNPLSWIDLMSRTGSTISYAPNFALDLVARAQPKTPPDWDLSRWRIVGSGGEMVRRETIEAFTAKLTPYGLAPNAVVPAYGLAEAVAGVTSLRPGESIRTVRYQDRDVVSCGVPVGNLDIRIEPDPDLSTGDLDVGEIQLRGESVVGPADSWFGTGDIGFLSDGDLFPCGRADNMILVRGKNVHSEEVEAVICETFGYSPMKVAAFGIPDDGTERVIALVADKAAAGETGAIAAAVFDVLGVTPDVEIVGSAAILRTSSGKLRRNTMRNNFINHDPDRTIA